MPLCAECLTSHTACHFVKADHKAASQVRSQLQGCQDTISTQADLYSAVLKETNQKIRQLDLEQKEEFTKIAATFKQLREMIFEREKEVKDVLFSQIKEAQ